MIKRNMKNHVLKKSESIVGEVVETFDAQGKRAAKIRIETYFIEILLMENEEAHLGDKVIMSTTISVTGVKPFVPVTRGEPS